MRPKRDEAPATVRRTIMLTPDEDRALRKAARDAGRSMSNFVRYLLASALKINKED